MITVYTKKVIILDIQPEKYLLYNTKIAFIKGSYLLQHVSDKYTSLLWHQWLIYIIHFTRKNSTIFTLIEKY